MSKLTVDDLVQSQQRNEDKLERIATLLDSKKKSKIQSLVFEAAGLISIVVWCLGAYLAYQGNMAGICICMIAISARIERLLSK